MPRFFIHDMGLVNALGGDKLTVAQNWRQGISPGMQKSDAFYAGHNVMLGSVVDALPEIPAHLSNYDCRNNRLLLHACKQMQNTIDAAKKHYGSKRIAIVLGTSTSGVANTELALAQYLQHGELSESYHFSQQDIGAGADFLRQHLDLEGPVVTVSTACSSSGNAFATARRLINSGHCDAAIVGGADSLCQLTVQGFSALKSVSAERCQPFSDNRCGINIGEAAALFFLTTEPSAIELYAVASSSDAHHISAPEPSGKGAIEAMKSALLQSGFSADAIDYINLHGTATPLNDAMESTAVAQLFGNNTLCSSSKSLTGHTLGAAAATELALCMLLLDSKYGFNKVPPHIWDGICDTELAEIHLAQAEDSVAEVKLCMSNSFAFGGNNCSVIIGKSYEAL